MAAARFSRNLIRLSTTLHTPPPPPRTFLTYRNLSSNPIEDPAELESADPNLTDLDHLLALQRIESAMHQVLVKKSTPGWLPFVPGGSYWVPPLSCTSKPHSVVEMVEKLSNSLTKEEKAAARHKQSVRTERGWPSTAYFFKGASLHSIEMEINANNKSQSEDEE